MIMSIWMMMMVMMMMMMMMWMCEPAQSKYEPAQSKYTWTFHKSHFVWKFTGTVPYANPATPVLCDPAQSKMNGHVRGILWEFTGKMAEDTSAASILCEPAQSKCTWTCHKRHFARKSTKENAKRPSIEHRALTVTVRTPQCGHTVWGIIHKLVAIEWGCWAPFFPKMALATKCQWRNFPLLQNAPSFSTTAHTRTYPLLQVFGDSER